MGETTRFKKMTANALIQRLIHIPPGTEIGMTSSAGDSCLLIALTVDGDLDEVLWDELETEGEEVKDSTAQRIEVIETANAQERDVLRAAYQFKATGQRKGQALMNALSLRAPELYHILTGSPNDPFHDDAKLQGAFDELGFKIRRFW